MVVVVVERGFGGLGAGGVGVGVWEVLRVGFLGFFGMGFEPIVDGDGVVELSVFFTFFVCGADLAGEDEVGVPGGGVEEVVDAADHFVFVGGGEVAYGGVFEEVGGRIDSSTEERVVCVVLDKLARVFGASWSMGAWMMVEREASCSSYSARVI